MDAVTYLQINLIPILALILMRVNTRRTLTYSWRNRDLRFMMVLLIMVMLANMAGWMLDGQQFQGAFLLLWFFNMVHFALLEFMAYLWYLYVCDVLDNGIGQRGIRVLGPAVPFLIFLVVLISTPWTKLIFYIDEQNCYVRGKGFLLHTFVTIGYVLVASIRALYHWKKEEQNERRSEYRLLAGFAVLPICGGVLQVVCYGLESLLPFTAASMLMVYINMQQRQVIRDALTGLNNRRRLDQYLLELDKQNCGSDFCHLLLLDVDSFKKINDMFGHVTGDQVLRLVADQLKKTFGNTRSFLARYGGDEFVIILKGKTDEEVEEYIRALREGVAKMNWGGGSPWKISVSVGCARYGEEQIHTVKELLNLADSRMYEEKKKNK